MTPLPPLRINLLAGLFVLLLALSTHAPAQIGQPSQNKKGLQSKVSLPLGTTTVVRVLQALSAQTGLKIKAADYLSEHRLTIHLRNVRAVEALDTLAELTGWKWQQTGENILLTRPEARIPRSVAEFPPALQSVLPKDFLRYAGIGVPLDWWISAAERASESFKYLAEEDALRSVMTRKLGENGVSDQIKNALWPELPPEVLREKPHRYSEWKPDLKRKVLVWLVVDTLREMIRDLKAPNTINGTFFPYQTDLRQAGLSFTAPGAMGRGMLFIGTVVRDPQRGSYLSPGFGWNLEFLTRSLPPEVEATFQP